MWGREEDLAEEMLHELSLKEEEEMGRHSQEEEQHTDSRKV